MGRFSTIVVLLLLLGLLPVTIPAENNVEEIKIEWENSGEITFLVPSNQWFQFGLGINSTALHSQNISIEIIGDSSWGINESIFEIKNEELSNQDSFNLDANESINITTKIFIPEIENGLPLSGIEYPFKIKVSNSSGAMKFWNYAISILPKYSLTIDEISEKPYIEPSGTVIHEIKIRNTGNIETQFNSQILPIDSEGNIIFTNETNRFAENGWNATLSGWVEALSLEPNESNVLKITLNSPYLSNSDLSLLLRINSNVGAISEDIYLNTSILTTKNSEIMLTDINCENIILSETCELNLKITNTGNYNEKIQQTNCFSNTDLISFNHTNPSNEIKLTEYKQNNEILNPNEFKDIEIELKLNQLKTEIPAGTIITILCNYYWENSTIIDSIELNITIGEYFEINYDLNPNSWIEQEKLFISTNLQNKGNVPESFAVSISVSHEGNHGLLPPENSTYDLNSSRIRGFDLLELKPNENFNITGWMDIPPSNIENETLWISLTVYTYSDSFENTWKEYLETIGTGSGNNSIEESNEISNFNSLKNIFNAYGYSALAIIISIIMIYNALKIRAQRNQTVSINKSTKNNDWMSTFHNKKNKELNLESPTINKNEFQQMFSEKSGHKNIENTPMPEKEILKDANEKINKINTHQEDEQIKSIDDLLNDINMDDEYDY